MKMNRTTKVLYFINITGTTRLSLMIFGEWKLTSAKSHKSSSTEKRCFTLIVLSHLTRRFLELSASLNRNQSGYQLLCHKEADVVGSLCRVQQCLRGNNNTNHNKGKELCSRRQWGKKGQVAINLRISLDTHKKFSVFIDDLVFV